MKKVVRVSGHSSIHAKRNTKELWCDVWLRFKDRRKTVLLAPCLNSFRYLLMDLDFAKDIQRQDNERPNNHESKLGAQDALDLDLEVLAGQRIINDLKNGATAVVEGQAFIEEVYTMHDLIDRAAANEMILEYLHQKGYNKNNIKVVWDKYKYKEFSISR